jgi:citrate synthase
MLTGERPGATIRAFDVALTLRRRLNASTFAGRVAAAAR